MLSCFKKSAKKLSRNEAVRLAAVLAKPSKLTPYHTKSVFMGKRLAVIAQNLYLHHTIDDSGYFSITGTLPPPPSTPMNKEKKSERQNEKKTDSLLINRTNF